jgi:3-methyladenine DNA glycosylase AlkD
MNVHHRQIRKIINDSVDKKKNKFDVANYLGSSSIYLNISVPKKRRLIREWAKENKDITYKEFVPLLNSLVQSTTFQEKSSVADLLVCFSEYRKQIPPSSLDRWLDHLSGWAEIDSLCQSTFMPGEILMKWDSWEKLIIKLSNDKNINKRRASLVLLTKAVRKQKDKRLKKLAFESISKLENEREILITKAVSWLLRELSFQYRSELKVYLSKHKENLPSIAYREAMNKLLTGRK